MTLPPLEAFLYHFWYAIHPLSVSAAVDCIPYSFSLVLKFSTYEEVVLKKGTLLSGMIETFPSFRDSPFTDLCKPVYNFNKDQLVLSWCYRKFSGIEISWSESLHSPEHSQEVIESLARWKAARLKGKWSKMRVTFHRLSCGRFYWDLPHNVHYRNVSQCEL
jgi:hypothetical protein